MLGETGAAVISVAIAFGMIVITVALFIAGTGQIRPRSARKSKPTKSA
jgi:hypothetical protein